jgi:hypothetical protein
MASDNTTTYNVVVETEVTGGEEVKQLGDDAEGAGGKFKSLRGQIRETTVQLQKLADEGKQGSAEFEKLRTKLDELNDAQDKVNFQAGQFDDQLASLPGPIGQVGGAIQGFNEGLNKFSLGFKVALGAVGLIIGAIAAFKESLSRTEEGQAKLNKITEAFTKIMNGVFAVIEPVAMILADLLVGLLENDKVMKALSVTMGVFAGVLTTVFGVVQQLTEFGINNLINGFKTLIGVASGAGKVIKGVFTFDLDLIKEGVAQVGDTVKTGVSSFVDNVKTTAKGIGTAVVDGVTTGFETGSKAFTEGAKRLTEEEKKAAEEAEAKRKERAQKAAEERKKQIEDNRKLIESAQKVEVENYLASLEARDQEIYKRGQKLNEDIAALEKAKVAKIQNGLMDAKKAEEEFQASKLAATESYNKEINSINEKYDKEASDKAKEKREAEYNDFKKGLDEQLIANDNSLKQLLQNEADNLDKKIALINEREQLLLSDVALTEAQRTQIVIDAEQARRDARTQALDEQLMLLDQESQALGTSFDRRREIIGQKETELLAQEGLTQAQRTQIVRQAAQERQAIDMAELEAKAELQNAYLDLASGFGSFLKEIAGKNKKLAIAGVIVEQAAAIGKIIVNTGIANAKAVAVSPLTGGLPWVAINTASAALSIASSVAAGVKAIQQINASDSGTAPSAGGSLPRSSGGAAAAPTPPTVERAALPQITGTQGQATPGQQIAQTLAARTEKPLKAYVVSGDVTSQQALDRRTTRAATFSGGTNG